MELSPVLLMTSSVVQMNTTHLSALWMSCAILYCIPKIRNLLKIY
jgi:hypothetical protein